MLRTDVASSIAEGSNSVAQVYLIKDSSCGDVSLTATTLKKVCTLTGAGEAADNSFRELLGKLHLLSNRHRPWEDKAFCVQACVLSKNCMVCVHAPTRCLGL